MNVISLNNCLQTSYIVSYLESDSKLILKYRKGLYFLIQYSKSLSYDVTQLGGLYNDSFPYLAYTISVSY